LSLLLEALLLLLLLIFVGQPFLGVTCGLDAARYLLLLLETDQVSLLDPFS
jgi:hypothetical protein